MTYQNKLEGNQLNETKSIANQEIEIDESDTIDITTNKDVVYIQPKQIKFLDDAIKRIHMEANFAAKSFDVKSVEFASNLNDLMGQFQKTLTQYDNLVKQHVTRIEQNQQEFAGLTLIPEKLQNRIENIAPQFVIEIEKLHSERLDKINLNLSELENKFGEYALQKQAMLEDIAQKYVDQIHDTQLKSLEFQKQQITEFSKLVKDETQAVLSNHGSRFLLNLTISLILATIAGGITSWSVGKYFPSFIEISKTGNVSIQNSAVKIWESDKIQINDANSKSG